MDQKRTAENYIDNLTNKKQKIENALEAEINLKRKLIDHFENPNIKKQKIVNNSTFIVNQIPLDTLQEVSKHQKKLKVLQKLNIFVKNGATMPIELSMKCNLNELEFIYKFLKQKKKIALLNKIESFRKKGIDLPMRCDLSCKLKEIEFICMYMENEKDKKVKQQTIKNFISISEEFTQHVLSLEKK